MTPIIRPVARTDRPWVTGLIPVAGDGADRVSAAARIMRSCYCVDAAGSRFEARSADSTVTQLALS